MRIRQSLRQGEQPRFFRRHDRRRMTIRAAKADSCCQDENPTRASCAFFATWRYHRILNSARLHQLSDRARPEIKLLTSNMPTRTRLGRLQMCGWSSPSGTRVSTRLQHLKYGCTSPTLSQHLLPPLDHLSLHPLDGPSSTIRSICSASLLAPFFSRLCRCSPSVSLCCQRCCRVSC